MKRKRCIWCEYEDHNLYGGRSVIVAHSRKNLVASFAQKCRTYYAFRYVFPTAPKYQHGKRFRIVTTNAKVIKFK